LPSRKYRRSPRSPHDGDSRLTVIQPRKPGTTARHAKEDMQPTLSLPIDAKLGQSQPRVAEHL